MFHSLCYNLPILKRGLPENLEGRGAEPALIQFGAKTLWIILTYSALKCQALIFKFPQDSCEIKSPALGIE
jgi:hypothetical protein